MDLKKDLIGIYSIQNEGTKFWLNVLKNLKQGSFEDISHCVLMA